jgi:quercetin dioxygenase-like cupin family protein
MTHYVKNVDFAKPVDFKELVAYQEGQVVSRTLVQGKPVSVTLFAFAEGEEISSHASSGDAIVQVLDGSAEITIGTEKFIVRSGESIVMPADIPHALFAREAFKMILTVIFTLV